MSKAKLLAYTMNSVGRISRLLTQYPSVSDVVSRMSSRTATQLLNELYAYGMAVNGYTGGSARTAEEKSFIHNATRTFVVPAVPRRLFTPADILRHLQARWSRTHAYAEVLASNSNTTNLDVTHTLRASRGAKRARLGTSVQKVIDGAFSKHDPVMVNRVLDLVTHVYAVLANRQSSYDALFNGLVDFMGFHREPPVCTLNDPRVLEMHYALCHKRDQRRIARMERSIDFAQTRLSLGKPESFWSSLEERADGAESLFLESKNGELSEVISGARAAPEDVGSNTPPCPSQDHTLALHLYDNELTYGSHIWGLWRAALDKANAIRGPKARDIELVKLSKAFESLHGKSEAARRCRSIFRALTDTYKTVVETASNDTAYDMMFRTIGSTNKSRDPFAGDNNSIAAVFHATTAVQKFGWVNLADDRTLPVLMGEQTTTLLREVAQIVDVPMPSKLAKPAACFEQVMNAVLEHANAKIERTSGRVAVNSYRIAVRDMPLPEGYKLYDAERCIGKDGHATFYTRVLHTCKDCKDGTAFCPRKRSYSEYVPKYRAELETYMARMRRIAESEAPVEGQAAMLRIKAQDDLVRATRLQRNMQTCVEVTFSKRTEEMFRTFEGVYKSR